MKLMKKLLLGVGLLVVMTAGAPVGNRRGRASAGSGAMEGSADQVGGADGTVEGSDVAMADADAADGIDGGPPDPVEVHDESDGAEVAVAPPAAAPGPAEPTSDNWFDTSIPGFCSPRADLSKTEVLNDTALRNFIERNMRGTLTRGDFVNEDGRGTITMNFLRTHLPREWYGRAVEMCLDILESKRLDRFEETRDRAIAIEEKFLEHVFQPLRARPALPDAAIDAAIANLIAAEVGEWETVVENNRKQWRNRTKEGWKKAYDATRMAVTAAGLGFAVVSPKGKKRRRSDEDDDDEDYVGGGGGGGGTVTMEQDDDEEEKEEEEFGDDGGGKPRAK